MNFESILFHNTAARVPEADVRTPGCFPDLNLDQIIAAITAPKAEYNLTSFFHMPLHDVDAVMFRHEVMRDLEQAPVFDAIKAFALDMHSVREHLAHLEDKHGYQHQKERWFLDAVEIYGEGVTW